MQPAARMVTSRASGITPPGRTGRAGAELRERIYYEDQGDWRPADYYALFRYLNRLFLNDGGRRSDEIGSLDLTRVSAETKHLLKHLLAQKGALDRVIDEYPNLAELDDLPELDRPIRLSDEPMFVYPYFTAHGIYL